MISSPNETWPLVFVSLFSFHLLKAKSLKTDDSFKWFLQRASALSVWRGPEGTMSKSLRISIIWVKTAFTT